MASFKGLVLGNETDRGEYLNREFKRLRIETEEEVSTKGLG